ncbi:MAG: hypothetical protein IT424_00715 [Pirellulales bacterium]|nr:hypothetical protein [Pirellulales bacterium]
MTNPGSTSTTPPHPVGTSYAAPHVTATVALIQELGNRNTADVGGPHWSSGNHVEHEVSKAVLLNSADKLLGVHGSPRTVISKNDTGSYNWENSPAYTDDTQPLDIQFGAGHLNALRAVVQMGPGEWDGGEDIPYIGWDLGETGGVGTTLRYNFENDLATDEWVAITLTWDREVSKTGSDNTYAAGDIFTVGAGNGLSNLDLFLVPEGSNDFGPNALNTRRSVATEQNVEHIFAKVPATGSYDIVIRQVEGGPESELDFGLAWWYGNPFVPTITPGDFDEDGDVDGDDLDGWKSSFGTGSGADADGDGDSDGADFLAWQQNFGTTAAVPSAAAVPEPTTISAMLCGMAVVLMQSAVTRRRRG